MAKETASFKIKRELKDALTKKAVDYDRTLSYLLEKIVVDYCRKNKIS